MKPSVKGSDSSSDATQSVTPNPDWDSLDAPQILTLGTVADITRGGGQQKSEDPNKWSDKE